MKFLIIMAGIWIALFGIGSLVGRWLRRCDQTPYQPDATKRRYRPDMAKPDARYAAVDAKAAHAQTEAIRAVLKGENLQPTPESVEAAKAWQRGERLAAGLDPNTGEPIHGQQRIH